MRHEPALDGLRAVAIIAVVLFHCGHGVLPGGYAGVDLFFVLSGFLITSILASEWERTGTIELRRFYLRRFLRLAPPLLLMLAIFVCWAPFVWPGENHFLDAGIAAAYVADYSIPLFREPNHLGHMWSLAIEEQFYLIWPWLLVPVIRSRKAAVILVGAFVAVTLWRYSFTEMLAMYNRLDTHCSGLILGCLLYFVRYRPSSVAVYLAGAVFVAICAVAPPFYDGSHGHLLPTAFIITPAELAAFVLVAGAYFGDNKLNVALRSAIMVWIGRLSYGIYLWHVPIARALRQELSFFWTFAIVAGVSATAAAISYFTVEAWARKRRYAKGQESRPALA